MNNKSRRERFSDNAEREEVIVIVNSNQINQNVDRSISRSRFETSELESESNFRAITQSSKDQMNNLNCYNCERFEHFFRNCRQSRKSMNLNNFVREMNVHEKNNSSIEISRSNREKNNLCYSRCKDRWSENNENWCLQLWKQSFRW